MKDFLARFVHTEASLTLAEAQEKFLQNRLIGHGFAEKTRRNYRIDVGPCEVGRGTGCRRIDRLARALGVTANDLIAF